VQLLGVVIFIFFGAREEIYIFWKSTFLNQKRKIFDPFNTSGMSNPDTMSNNNMKSNKSNVSSPGEKEVELDVKDSSTAQLQGEKE